ncbi:MAG TPA: hypothetical protein VD971_07795 [Phycisphaerales bacterium]|nr:hypothetical protein [Phycisphaerales bacterium]
MKKVWTILSVIAVANMIAVAGLLLWLKAGDRLSVERARAVRAVFTKTVAQEKKDKEAEAAALAAEAAKREQEAKEGKAPLSSAELLASRVELTDLDRERLERTRDEVEALRKQLSLAIADLEAKQAKLDADRKAWDAQLAEFARTTGDEQFQKTLGVLAAMKPSAAKQMLREMMGPATAAQFAPVAQNQPAAPAPSPGVARVVEYLNAMEDRARSRVMAEFAKEDPALAAQLLEALRQRGQTPRADAGT